MLFPGTAGVSPATHGQCPIPELGRRDACGPRELVKLNQYEFWKYLDSLITWSYYIGIRYIRPRHIYNRGDV
jgi:hypothetical protein